jgi:hypothetical protein
MSTFNHGMPLFHQPAFSPLNNVVQSKGKGRATDADLEEAFVEAEKYRTSMSTTEANDLNEAMDRLLLEQQAKTQDVRPLSDFQR